MIATRDRPDMLREAVRSVLAQDYQGPIEVLVVYDQTDIDHSVEGEARATGRSVAAVANTRRPGLAGARNSGIEASTGTYVAFCDDDDYWRPGRLSRQVEALERYPDAGLATCGITVQYDGEEFSRILEAELVSFEDLLRDRHTELHPSTFLLRRSAISTSIGLVEEAVPGGFGEDYEFLLRAARAHPIVNVRQPLTVVRWGKQSFFFRRWETMAAGLTWLLERYPEFEQSRVGSARIQGQIAFAQAAMGHRREALRWALRAARQRPTEPRLVLALAVAVRVISADRVMEMLHRRGRGI